MIHARSDYQRIQDPWAEFEGNEGVNLQERAIRKSEPVLLIRGQDKVGWIVVLVYAILHYIVSDNRTEALKIARICIFHALRMARWPRRKDADWPDDVQLEAAQEVDEAIG